MYKLVYEMLDLLFVL